MTFPYANLSRKVKKAAVMAAVLVFAFLSIAALVRPSVAAANVSLSNLSTAQKQLRLQAVTQDLENLNAQKAALNANASAGDAGMLPDKNGQYGKAATVAAAEIAPADVFMLGKIERVQQGAGEDVGGISDSQKTFSVRITGGNEKGTLVTVNESDLDVASQNRPLHVGDVVVVVKSFQDANNATYYIADNYRIPSLILMTLLFFGLAVLFGRLRGLTSIFGLAVTVGVIVWYVVPKISAGGNPLTVCVIGAFLIAATSLYLAHGFNSRTTVAFVGTCLTLGFSSWMAVQFVSWAHLFGTGSEDALFLQGSGFDHLDLRGLLLGGIILGVLGILDDITTAQAAIVEELKRANPRYGFADLYKRGLSVGKEHIASLINTLFLAYAGASLPLFLLFSANKGQPLWFIVNSGTIAEEIVRTLVGSICLILAVPVTTALAASLYSERPPKPEADADAGSHVHHH